MVKVIVQFDNIFYFDFVCNETMKLSCNVIGAFAY